MKIKRLLANATFGVVLISSNPSHALFGVGDIVLDPANLAQNVLQVVEAIEEGLRTLEQIELATKSTEGTDFSLRDGVTARLIAAQDSLNEGGALVFEQARSLEQFRDEFPATFETFDKLEAVSSILQGQNQTLLDASQQAVQIQSSNAEALGDVFAAVSEALGVSESATGQTQAIQAGNQLQGLVISMLGELGAANLASQRLDALKAANEASERKAADDADKRFFDGSDFKGARFDGVLPDGWVE